jgi:adenylate cyclase
MAAPKNTPAIPRRRTVAELEAELERRTAERDEALRQQTATAEVLQVITASPGDLQPVFEAILEKAHTLCGAALGSLGIFDGEIWRAVVQRGYSEPLAERLRRGVLGSDNEWMRGLIDGADLVHIPDLAEFDYPIARANVAAGIRALLLVPLRNDSALLGTISIARREAQPFTDKQIALLRNFAAQAVIAIENARLVTETREALDQQTATAEVLGVINSSPGDLGPVFDAIVEKAHTLCAAGSGSLQLWDGQKFRGVAIRGFPEAMVELLRAGYSPSGLPCQRIVEGERVVHCTDLAEITRELGVKLGGVRTVLYVALRKDDVLLGQIVAVRQEVRPFSEKEIALVENFAAQAVIAMENARLLTETREALEQQTATAEVLGVINSSPGDLRPVFGKILEKAYVLCDASGGDFVTYDGEYFHSVAMQGMTEQFGQTVMQRPYSHPPDHPLHILVRGEQRFVHIADTVAELAELMAVDPMTRAAVEQGGVRTVLMVPLRKDDTLLGVIIAQRREARPFSDRQIALMESFAAQAVIAMDNARLLGELRQRNDEIARWNKELEDRVAAQLGELERVGKLKRFLAPQLAELIVARGDEAVLETHRRDIVVVFCDLRDFTAFAETAEPEEVLDLLREYHAALGPIVSASEGTLDHFSGDGIMVFFNDPVPVADASERAVGMAIDMRAAMAGLQTQWRRQGRRIGFGAGIARGYATLGQIGFADRIDYTAIGTVCNLAARLCAEAKDGQILVSQRVAAAVEEKMPLEEIGEVALKGLSQPVAVYNVPLAGGQTALRVIEGGTPSA